MARSALLIGGVLTVVSAVSIGQTLPAAAQTVAADVAHGQAIFESRCVACHSLDANRVGPALHSVVGRVAGKAPDYFYSEAMAAATHTWTRDKLKAWLTNPEAVVPGQTMNYRVDLAQDRDDVVAYLASLVISVTSAPAAAKPDR